MSNREIEFSDTDIALREDVALLGAMVGELLQEQAGNDLFALRERLGEFICFGWLRICPTV